jgi:hypothetical protein
MRLDAQNKLDELAAEIVALKGVGEPVARAHTVGVPNIVGLLLALAGVLLLFRYGMPYELRTGGHQYEACWVWIKIRSDWRAAMIG